MNMIQTEARVSVTAEELVERANQSVANAGRGQELIGIEVQDSRIVLRSGDGVARRARVRAAALGAAVALAGCGLLFQSPLYAFLIVAGAAYAVAAPRRIRPQELIAIDTDSRCVQGSSIVPMARVRAIRGAFETKGWDGFSVVSAVLDDGSCAPLLMLLGADERLAEAVCSTLGAILDCPAEYTGTSGAPVACHPRPAH